MATRPDDDLDPWLESALRAALAPPAPPPGFQQRLQAAWARQAAEDLARRRHALEAEHARQMQALQRGYVRLKRDTLALVLAVAFTAGAAASWAVPWLRETRGIDLSTLLPLLAVAIGMTAGAGVWVDRFGLPWKR
ncbi:hypothetical protein [Ideonella sp.]|uniref:hypothetical protein n=1 Tax=Ideonella sp. TaxID=1929293 RepID=UPI002B484E29|nr:hypothetical protein [Ideonella sp.]HJV68142.1 hypothetical protein [Ideonella sp.]